MQDNQELEPRRSLPPSLRRLIDLNKSVAEHEEEGRFFTTRRPEGVERSFRLPAQPCSAIFSELKGLIDPRMIQRVGHIEHAATFNDKYRSDISIGGCRLLYRAEPEALTNGSGRIRRDLFQRLKGLRGGDLQVDGGKVLREDITLRIPHEDGSDAGEVYCCLYRYTEQPTFDAIVAGKEPETYFREFLFNYIDGEGKAHELVIPTTMAARLLEKLKSKGYLQDEEEPTGDLMPPQTAEEYWKFAVEEITSVVDLLHRALTEERKRTEQ